jgi:hypothetical protein
MKRKGLYLFLAVLLLIVGFRIATYSLPVAVSKTGTTATGLYEYRGLIHLHTTYSDGAGTVEEIAAAGNLLGLDFLISTDHNTLQPLIDQKERWYDHLLFLSGEEISMEGGYILAIGIPRAVKGKEREPQTVVDEVRELGGMAFIAHPLHRRFGWKNWGVTGVTGMEIIDADHQWKEANRLLLLWSLMTYPLNPSYALLNLYQRPQDVLERWDELIQRERVVGIFSPDLHDQFRVAKRYYIKFPPRERVMPFASNHVLLREPFNGDLVHDKKILYDALRGGHLFLALDLLGDPRGFLFQGATGSGKPVLMGDGITEAGMVTLTASLGTNYQPELYRIKLFRNGLLIADSSKTPLTYEAHEQGAYRAEVELLQRSPFFINRIYTWIYSNPIYIRGLPLGTG